MRWRSFAEIFPSRLSRADDDCINKALCLCGRGSFAREERKTGKRTAPGTGQKIMQEAGLEPARYCYHRHLKPARLPIPPFLHLKENMKFSMSLSRADLYIISNCRPLVNAFFEQNIRKIREFFRAHNIFRVSMRSGRHFPYERFRCGRENAGRPAHRRFPQETYHGSRAG